MHSAQGSTTAATRGRFAHLNKWTKALISAAMFFSGYLAMFAPLAPIAACTTEDCLGATAVFDGGEMIDPNTWESNPINGDWQPYTPALNLILHIPEAYGRTPWNMIAQISPVPRPNDPLPNGDVANNWTIAAGNLAEFQTVADFPADDAGPAVFSLTVHNDTCASYYTRIVIQFVEQDAAATATDGAAVDANAAGPSAEDAGDGGDASAVGDAADAG